MARVVEVRCAVAALEKTFDYLAESDTSVPLEIGTSVRVQLGGRRVNGWITDVDVEPPPGVELRPLRALRGYGPTKEVVELASWAAWRWSGPTTRFLSTASSLRNVTSLPVAPKLGAAEIAHAQRDVDDEDLVSFGRAQGEAGVAVLSTGAQSDPFGVIIGLLDALTARLRLGGNDGTLVIAAPSVAYAARLVDRLCSRGLPAVHFADAWSQVRAGWPVVVGTRAVAFAPVPNLRAVVMLDAHDESYREERSPTWSARDVLVERARRQAIPLIAPTPVVTAALTELATRCGDLGPRSARDWPAVVIDDQRDRDPREGLFSPSFIDVARRALAAPVRRPGPRLVVLLNRVGRSRLLSCRSCGVLASCANCSRSVSDDDGQLRCRSCGTVRPMVCLSCGSGAMRTVRAGVSKVAPELAALLRVEVSDVTAASDPSALLAPVLVGTEAVLHRVRHAHSVAVFELDQHLFAPRLAALEETLALLVRAARLLGPRTDPASGVLHLATRLPEHPVVRGLVHGDLTEVLAADVELRRSVRLPPFSAIAELTGPDARAAVGILEPMSLTSVSELVDDRVLVQAGDHTDLANALAAVRAQSLDVRIEVDPISL